MGAEYEPADPPGLAIATGRASGSSCGGPRGAGGKRLIDQPVALAGRVAAVLVEGAGACVSGPELQLQPHAPSGAQGALGGGRESAPDPARALRGEHEELVDLGHEPLVLDGQDQDRDQVTDEAAAGL